MVLALFWIRVDSFGAFLDEGCWCRHFSKLGLVVLALSWIRVEVLTLFWIRFNDFDAFLDQV